MEEDETEEKAIKREVKEETGLEIEILERVGEKIIKNFEGIWSKSLHLFAKLEKVNP